MNSGQTSSQSPAIDQLENIAGRLKETPWLIACLCAAWCDTCQAYRKQFEALPASHPDKCFAWIDIEDHAELVNDLDIENFPTILIEYQGRLLFLGTMLPDANHVHKLIQSYESNLLAKPVENIAQSIQETNQGLPSGWNLTQQLRAS